MMLHKEQLTHREVQYLRDMLPRNLRNNDQITLNWFLTYEGGTIDTQKLRGANPS